MGRGSGSCNSCMIGEEEERKSKVKLNVSKSGFLFNEVLIILWRIVHMTNLNL